MNTTEVESTTSYLSFQLGDELFAAHVGKVLEILEITKITKVPKAPSYMRGVINLRGAVLPVIDTRIKFSMEPTEDTVDTCIIVLQVTDNDETIHVGALVDSVQEVLELGEGDLQPPPSIGSSYKTEFISGMAKANDDVFIMVLEIDTVFNAEDLIELKEAAKQPNKETKTKKAGK